MMSRFEQRQSSRLQNAEIATGHREMDAEVSLLHLSEAVRENPHVSTEELPDRISDESRGGVM
jgi:hypothetical protein